MDLKPQQLEAQGYLLMVALSHQELLPFVKENLKKKSWFARGYFGLNIFFAVGLIGIISFYSSSGYSLDALITQLSIGIVLALLLIPLHEYLHVLAYKSQGAEQTSYKVNWRKFYFMALADGFVANRREFSVVALTPFLVITLALLILQFFLPPVWQVTCWSMLLTHTACCSGDFALLGYFETNKATEVLTYDDHANGMSYFYGRPHPSGAGDK